MGLFWSFALIVVGLAHASMARLAMPCVCLAAQSQDTAVAGLPLVECPYVDSACADEVVPTQIFPPFRLGRSDTEITLSSILEGARDNKIAIVSMDMWGNRTFASWSEMYLIPASDLHKAYYRPADDCLFGLFDEAGKLLDGCLGFDRIQQVDIRDFGEDVISCAVIYSFEGTSVLQISDAGLLEPLAWFNQVPTEIGCTAFPLYYDIDGDSRDEAILKANAGARALVRDRDSFAFLDDYALPDGTPVCKLTHGVVAVNLLSPHEPPFVYYPCWNIADVKP